MYSLSDILDMEGKEEMKLPVWTTLKLYQKFIMAPFLGKVAKGLQLQPPIV